MNHVLVSAKTTHTFQRQTSLTNQRRDPSPRGDRVGPKEPQSADGQPTAATKQTSGPRRQMLLGPYKATAPRSGEHWPGQP